MSAAARPAPPADVRRARIAVAALFFTNGAIFANLVPRYPEVKAALGLDNAAYGLAIAAFPAGSILAGLAAGALIRRFGSARVAVATTILVGLAVFLAALAPTAILFAAALFVGGAMDALTDVAQNAHGLRVQRRYGRSIINSLHAVWSIGAVAGGAMGAAAIAVGLPIGVHLVITWVLFAALALTALRYCLPGTDEPAPATGQTPAPTRSVVTPKVALALAALTLIAIAGAVVEDAGSTWAALYLSGSLHAPAAIASFGYIALVGAQFIGRTLGDRQVDRYGQRAVARLGGALVLAGMGLALAFPSIPGTIAGFAAAGYGVATLIPAAMHTADELPGLRHGTGLTVLSWLMRIGFLLAPPAVGLIADATTLRIGLLLVPAAGLVVIALAGALHGRRR